MNILVLYQSRSGHTRSTAEAIAHAASTLGHKVNIRSVIEVQKADIESADLLFLGTWVQGFILFGVKPAGADLWVRALPPSAGKPVGIFCTFAFNPRASLRTLGNMLAERGAQVVGQRAFHRNRPGDGVEEFVRGVVQAAEHTVA